MKKKGILNIVLFMTIFILSYGILYQQNKKKNIYKKQDKKNVQNLKFTEELKKEQKKWSDKFQELQNYEENLKNYEQSLKEKSLEIKKKIAFLKKEQKEFKELIEKKIFDRQTISTYEAMENEQAATIIMNMYKKDPDLACRLIRKMPGDKSGEILNSMTIMDKELSTEIATKALKFFKPKSRKNKKN